VRCTATSKRSGGRCKRHATPGYEVCYYHGARGGAPAGNKNAVVTGEHEAIWVDQLTDEERGLYARIRTEALAQLDEEIRLTTLRERRMLGRIARLAGPSDGVVAQLSEVQRIEEALTRVQERKAKLLELAHKLRQAEDDGAIDALVDALQRSRREAGRSG
jgi:uncharacterized protein YjcR